MNAHIRMTATVLVPLLALAPSCAAPNRNRTVVRLELDDGETVIHVPETGGQPIEVPAAELWSSFRVAARELQAPTNPLAFAEQMFGLTEASGTYWYFPRSDLLLTDSLGGRLEEAEGATEKLTRGYLEWCGGTRLSGSADCLHLLHRSKVLTLHGRYALTLVMAMTASFGPMLDSLKELADPNAVAVMLASAVAVYLLLLLVPEPISKLISLSITGGLIGYLGLDMFWSLVYGWQALAKAVDAATDFNQLQAAARTFGQVLGPQMGQLLILLVSHSLGKGLAATGKPPPPRYAEATAQAERLLRVRPAAVAAVRSVTLGAGVITISLATSATVVTGPSPAPSNQERFAGRTSRLTRQEARRLAEELGFKEVKDPPFDSRGEPAFKQGNRFITPDRDGHSGGTWKLFDQKGNRLGTYNDDLSIRIGN